MHDTDARPDSSAGAASHWGAKRFLMIGVTGFGLILAGGAAFRVHHASELEERTEASAIPTVTVMRPGGDETDTLILPGRIQAWNQAPVFARTNGYLRRWYVDIGQTVRAGQVLAVIDTPEVDQQLIAARAALATAEAERRLAQTTAERWDRLVAQRAVAQQEADERRGAFAAREASRNEASANVERLRALSGFKQIVAPFAGTVTGRTTEIGALIVANTPTSQPLFTVADVARLRLYVSVPQTYVARMRDGMTAGFTVPDHPGQTFEARIDRSAEAVDPASGAMLVQLVYDNHAGTLKPGAYAQVTFRFDAAAQQSRGSVRIPVSSLLFRREGPTVALADRQGRVQLRAVKIQTDFGTELAVLGLRPADMVIDNPPEDLRSGDRVRPTVAKKAQKDA